MLSTSSLVFVTLFASLFTAGSAVKVSNPSDLVQCKNTTLEWTGGKGPYTVEVYTSCDDDDDDAITRWEGVTGHSVQYYVNRASGIDIFVRVYDSDDKDESFSDDVKIGGDKDDADKCWKSIKDNNLDTQSFSAKDLEVAVVSSVVPSTSKPSATTAPSANAADSGDDTLPTTMAGGGGNTGSGNTGSGTGGSGGVANAVTGPDSKKAAAGNTYLANGASSSKRFPAIEIVAGLLGAAIASLL